MSYNVQIGDRVKGTACIFVLAVGLAAGQGDLDRARDLYNRTEFDQSLRILEAIPQKDGAVYQLIGRNYFMQGEFKKATTALEKSVAADPGNSDWALWLGRAWGRRAETSNPFSAMGQASKARQYFERAAELDPRNLDALNDLLEYYLEAPGILGGGLDKAKLVAAKIAQIDAAEGHWAQARLAEKHNEYGRVEDQLRSAIDVAPHQAGRLIDLAKFLYKQGRYDEADLAFARAEKVSPNNPKLFFEEANAYIQAGRNLGTARVLLQRYLTSTVSPDDPPKADARKLLRQIQGG